MTGQQKEKKFGRVKPGKNYICEVLCYNSGRIETVELKGAHDEDCTWRTADDHSEVDEWNWDVISWVEKK